MTTKVTIIVTAIICLIVGGGAGYFGAQKLGMTRRGFTGQRMGNFQMMNSGRVIGSVQSMADGRLTVQSPNNNSQIILVNGSTMYQKMTNGTASDVTTGTQVIVMGTKNPDGSTTATSIQIVNRPTTTPQ